MHRMACAGARERMNASKESADHREYIIGNHCSDVKTQQDNSLRPAEFPLEAFRTVNCDEEVEHGRTAQHPSQNIDGLQSDTFASSISVTGLPRQSLSMQAANVLERHTTASRLRGFVDCRHYLLP